MAARITVSSRSLGNDVAGAEGGDPLGQRPFAGDQGVDARQNRIIGGQRPQLRPHPEQGLGLVGEPQLLALQHPQPRRGRRDMSQQIGAALAALVVQSPFGQGLKASGQGGHAFGQLGQGARIGLGRLGPFGRAVIGVDIARLALADLQRQGDIVAGYGVQTVARRLRRCGAGGQQGGGARQGGDGDDAHGCSLSSTGTLGRRAPCAKKGRRAEIQGLRRSGPCCKHRRPALAPRTHP
jgi:hypothetical protein